MPRRPAASGYERLAQADEEEYLDNSDDELPPIQRVSSDTQYAPIQPGRRDRISGRNSGHGTPRRRPSPRHRSNSGVDIKAINARLERWADEIASKFKIRKKSKGFEDERLEIHYSVFQPPDGFRPRTPDKLIDHPEKRLTKAQFNDTVESIRVAIEQGMHPKMISQGSSGSYFARNSEGKTVGVFKPKDEEPYASRNPKWTKWIHRNLFPCFFGRACLIPNLSYVSEAAAYVLDSRLQTNIVPYTDIVSFSSIAFHYDLWERRAYYRKRKPLPFKIGSLQVFLRGYQDATHFLNEHPWPDQTSVKSRSASRKRRSWADRCRGSVGSDDENEDEEMRPGRAETQQRKSFWTAPLQQSFREELEKLVILDYIMRNTDRGLDNWMIHIDEATQKASIVAEPLKSSGSGADDGDSAYARADDMRLNGSNSQGQNTNASIMIGAIDNSLSWPWKHPDAWRSFPFGWLFLPVSLIGQPFTQKTREHFLTLLTSKQWWSETQLALRHCFMQDSDFQEKMFAKQMAVMKGQAWNVVETLKTADHGPLELTRRTRVHVWDDIVDVPTAMPMVRSPPRLSLNTSRQHNGSARKARQPEEMDISSARGPQAPLDQALLGLDQQSNGLPNPNMFSLSRSESHGQSSEGLHENNETSQSRGRGTVRFTHKRMSSDLPRSPGIKRKGRKRNLSFTARAMSDYEEEDEGDLGYSAARDMEGNHKKVIVERLETVKARHPVFTWC